MVQLKIAVLDEEREYLEQLSAYLVRKRERFFRIWIFWDLESYERASEKEQFDAVLLTSAFLEELDARNTKAKIILFREDSMPKLAEHLPSVSKYQSAEQLFLQISALLWQENLPTDQMVTGKRTELIGVYSPVHYDHQMMFSLTMAQILGEHQKVLYFNLQEHSGFYGVTSTEAAEDMGDFIYGMMQREHDFQAGLHRIRRTFLNFDYIPPAVNPEHLSEIPRKLYEELFLELKNGSGYDMVIVDFGNIFPGFAEMIPVFGSFYCLGKEGGLNRYRTEEFLDYLKKESESTAAHIKNLILPDGILFGEEPFTLEKNIYGSLGDFVRSYLGGWALG